MIGNKILIVEDSSSNAYTLLRAIDEINNNCNVYPSTTDIVSYCSEIRNKSKESVQSLYNFILEEIQKNNIDTLFLDMSLNELEDRCLTYKDTSGYKILNMLDENMIDVKVIIFSNFKEVNNLKQHNKVSFVASKYSLTFSANSAKEYIEDYMIEDEIKLSDTFVEAEDLSSQRNMQ